MTTLSPKISCVRVAVVAAILLISAGAAFYFGDDFRLSEKPSEYIGVVFSILAASLFAVVSIIGDPSMIVSGNSRHAWENGKVLQKEMQKFNILIIWYLLTLGFLVVSEVAEHSKYANFYWTTSALVFFATSGFLFSLFVPFDFAQIQRRRLQQEINARSAKVSTNGE